jgi:hypothetical protein
MEVNAMPARDGTGPFCQRAQPWRPGWARNWRGGEGRGFGFCRFPRSQEDEKELLEQRKSWLETQLEAIRLRLSELEKA